MIIFEAIRWKNFLSTGNNWTEINLIKSKSFSLFGRAHRNITKSQLINSINNKNCEVEVKFTIGKSKFRVLRGIKPNTFEIWKNGDMINQSSHSREYQKILEQNIIKLNHKSFHQIVVLGSSSFIPFMQLPAHHRRDVIEDHLDINIFSKMNTILKEKNLEVKNKLKENAHQLDLIKNSLDSQRKYIRDITQINEDEIRDRNKKIDELHDEIQLLNTKNGEHSLFLEENSALITGKLKEYNDKRTSILHNKSTMESQIKSIVKDSKFYEDNDNCPTCSQPIEPEFKKQKIHECKTQATSIKTQYDNMLNEAQEVLEIIEEWNIKSEELRNRQSEINGNNKTIESLQNQVNKTHGEIEKLTSREGDLGKANEE